MKKTIFKTKSFWISECICLVPIIISIIFYKQLPEQVATHFDINFEPDGYSPKWQAAFIIPSFLALLNAFLWFIIENDPKKASINKKMKRIIHWLLPVISVFTHTSTIIYALNNNVNMITFLPVLIGLMLIIVGNYLPKCKQNYTTGIKLPWTLSSEENWNRTHRFGGKLMILCGFVLAMATFFKIPASIIILTIMLIVIAPGIYSYILYKKGV